MKQLTLHEKAVRLVEGGVVECGGHFVRFLKCPDGFFPCHYCEMDCLCHGVIQDLCIECCCLVKGDGYLELVCKKRLI